LSSFISGLSIANIKIETKLYVLHGVCTVYNTGIDRASEANNSSQADKKSGKIETWCKEMSSERRGQPPLAKLPARAHSVLQATSILSGARSPYPLQRL